MDNKKAIVLNSKKYGKGIFAKEDIKKGEAIAEFDGDVYKAKKASDLPKNIADHAIQFAEHKWIGSKGIAKYFNHSCSPNCGFKGKFKIIAMSNIKKGGELTIDYEMSEDSDWVMKCLCGSKSCRKFIGSFKNMPKEVRNKYKGYTSNWLRTKYSLN